MYEYTLVREWTQEGHIQEYDYEAVGSVKPHQEMVDVSGELFYNVSVMTAVVSRSVPFYLRQGGIKIAIVYLSVRLSIRPSVLPSVLPSVC